MHWGTDHEGGLLQICSPREGGIAVNALAGAEILFLLFSGRSGLLMVMIMNLALSYLNS